MGRVRIGVSGWSYDAWRGDFYPDDLPRRKELEYVGRHFTAVEVNGSFYSLLSPDTYRRYRAATPSSFRFALKGSRFITHSRRLNEPREGVANFLASGLLLLEERLDVILWQLPANHEVREERMRAFLDLLPKSQEAAGALAARHDQRVSEPVTESGGNHRIRHALEIRNADDLRDEVARMLREAGVALVFSHAGDWPYVEELTAGFVYLRLHGAPETYADRYDDRALEWFAERIRKWRDGGEPEDAVRITGRTPPRRKSRDVYVFFDNDARGHAPHDARRLMEMVQ